MTDAAARRVRQSLKDLIEQTAAAARLVERGKVAFDGDEILRLAAEAVIVRLGECVARIDQADPGFVGAHPELELRNLKDCRNVLAHSYDIVDYEIVWAILAMHLPVVAERVADWLRRVCDT